MRMRELKPNERLYTYWQSQQIMMQTGCIGYLRADMGSNGKGFFSSWNDFRSELKTQEFKDEFDNIINELREEGNLFQNRAALAEFCRMHHTEAAFGNDREYGVRIHTDDYAYLMRLSPYQGDYNVYCFCYKKDWLDSHLDKATRGIRFIDSGYNELFRIADGEKIIVTHPDGEQSEYTCRYIDDYHVKVNDNLFHICQFAEIMERNGNTYTPLKNDEAENETEEEFEAEM